jgi:hypothetical protein
VVKRSEVNDKVIEKVSVDIKEAREKMIAIFKILLNGDALAAEFMLLNLIAKVHTRHDALILGNISINITGLTTP